MSIQILERLLQKYKLIHSDLIADNALYNEKYICFIKNHLIFNSQRQKEIVPSGWVVYF